MASLPAGRCPMTFGYLPTKRGVLQMTSARRLSPEAHVDLQYLIGSLFRIANVVPVRLAKSIHELSLVTYADSGTL
eukprot:5986203-Pyramimonas_sp.AAC.1